MGAVLDADVVQEYLREHLGVPRSRIMNLRDSQATRTAIIEAIHAFSINPEIKGGDPILIYYAGYGGSTKTPQGWEVERSDRIELLIPYDYSSRLEDNRDSDNHKHGIPDRTLGPLLEHLARNKGDNIVHQSFVFCIYGLTT